MSRYYVHFSADHREPLPPVATLASVEAEDPPAGSWEWQAAAV